MVLLAEQTPPVGSSVEGVGQGQGRHQRVLAESIKYRGKPALSFNVNNRSPAVSNDSQNGIHCTVGGPP